MNMQIETTSSDSFCLQLELKFQLETYNNYQQRAEKTSDENLREFKAKSQILNCYKHSQVTTHDAYFKEVC